MWSVRVVGMCRSIKVLREGSEPLGADEIRAAALQYVRKVSGYRKPSKANEAVFERAVDEVAEATERLLGSIVVGARVAATR
jgi:hypothetical protein